MKERWETLAERCQCILDVGYMTLEEWRGPWRGMWTDKIGRQNQEDGCRTVEEG